GVFDTLLPYILHETFSLASSTFVQFYFTATAPTEIYTLSLHDALPIWPWPAFLSIRSTMGFTPASAACNAAANFSAWDGTTRSRSEEHTSELQSRGHLVCRLLLEKKNDTVISSLVPRLSLRPSTMT